MKSYGWFTTKQIVGICGEKEDEAAALKVLRQGHALTAAPFTQPAPTEHGGCEAEDCQTQSSAHGLSLVQKEDENHNPTEQLEQTPGTGKLGRRHLYPGLDPACLCQSLHGTQHCA